MLQQIYPLLRTYKAERSRLILEQYIVLTPRNGKYSEALRAQRACFENKVLGIRAGARNGVASSSNQEQ